MENPDLGVIIVINLDTLVTYATLSLCVVTVIGLDTLVICYSLHGRPPKIAHVLDLTPQIINGLIYLKMNIMSIFKTSK